MNPKPTIEQKMKRMLKEIDTMSSYTEKLEYLNDQFLKAKTKNEEGMILELIEQLKFYGK